MTIEALSPYDIATGFPLDPDPRTRRPYGFVHPVPSCAGPIADALGVLEDLVVRALRRPPCFVHFSGGRDSSALLAVAAKAARSHGLDLPIPLTVRFPNIDEAQEDRWQELVIRHLELTEWLKMDVEDTADLLAPPAVEVLR